jgi:glycosyltransferase involved in cell wall biosynthesis
VLVLNDYALRSGLARHARGDYPAHLLQGVVELQERFDLHLLREPRKKPSSRLARNLRTQLRGLLAALTADVVVSAGGYETVFLGLARHYLKRDRPGLVAIVHRPAPPGPAGRLLLAAYAGHDAMLCISPVAYDQLTRRRIPGARRVDWGVDLSFYPATPLPEDGPLEHRPVRIFSVGKTKRDHDVLVSAMAGVDAELVLYTDEPSAPTVPAPGNVTVHVAPAGREGISYAELKAEYARSHLVAVPLRQSRDLNGISSVVEAMASGRGVLCTRTDGLAVDPEKLGFGRCLPVGDEAAWHTAIAEAVSDRARLAEWGRRARSVAEADYDFARFAAELAWQVEAAKP